MTVAEALDYVHRAEFIHRDVCPRNFICITRSADSLKLIDFGLGRAVTRLVAERLATGREAGIPELVWTMTWALLGVTSALAIMGTALASQALAAVEGELAVAVGAAQVAAGEENNLSIQVYGENGGLEWHQQEPNTLIVKWLDKPTEILRAGTGFVSDIAKHNARTPGGHPEGYLEAFANIYRNFTFALSARINGSDFDKTLVEFPSVEEGIRGMAFIENVVKSNDSTEKWTPFTI